MGWSIKGHEGVGGPQGWSIKGHEGWLGFRAGPLKATRGVGRPQGWSIKSHEGCVGMTIIKAVWGFRCIKIVAVVGGVTLDFWEPIELQR